MAFGRPIADQGVVQEQIAQSRIEIEPARLLCHLTARTMDVHGNASAAALVSMAKVTVPAMALRVIDRAIQVHGAMGVSDDVPLAAMFGWHRSMRIFDGPDEVHLRTIARAELMKSRQDWWRVAIRRRWTVDPRRHSHDHDSARDGHAGWRGRGPGAWSAASESARVCHHQPSRDPITRVHKTYSGARVFDNLEALESSVGTHLGKSSWREVAQDQVVDTFADLTLDHQWIHVDVERASQSPFGGTVAHGFLTLGMVPTMAQEVYRYEGFAMSLNYGASKLRFPGPLPVGARIRGSFELAAVTQTKAGYLVQVDATVEVEGATKPACFLEWLVMLIP